MRTTLTIDDSIMGQLKSLSHTSGSPLKQVVNEVLELGLRQMKQGSQPEKFNQKTYSMGMPTSHELDKAMQLASHLEDKEIAKKLELRK